MKLNNKFEFDVFWGTPKFKDTMDFHWCEAASLTTPEKIGEKTVNKLVEVTRMFCRKSDLRCFVEDLFSNELFEFSGAKAQGINTMTQIIFKHKKENILFKDKENEKLSNNRALE